ncbi:hypothetical protein [Pseudomonas akapageensis]|uniref:hypothetical protein n=1 Tax=Pseudomonas akapageensis TaxID=2609961 RepID=UPI00140CC4EB|nr:hypothetical protein [Pseudomonas akapageensis]
MKVVSSLALMATVGCISLGAAASEQIVAVPLHATIYNAGHIAQATLTPLSSNQTELNLYVSDLPGNTAIPAHLYTYVYSGTCASHGTKAAYELNQFVNTDFDTVGVGFRLWKSVPVSYDKLRSGGYALVVRAAPADGNRDLFCGNLSS